MAPPTFSKTARRRLLSVSAPPSPRPLTDPPPELKKIRNGRVEKRQKPPSKPTKAGLTEITTIASPAPTKSFQALLDLASSASATTPYEKFFPRESTRVTTTAAASPAPYKSLEDVVDFANLTITTVSLEKFFTRSSTQQTGLLRIVEDAYVKTFDLWLSSFGSATKVIAPTMRPGFHVEKVFGVTWGFDVGKHDELFVQNEHAFHADSMSKLAAHLANLAGHIDDYCFTLGGFLFARKYPGTWAEWVKEGRVHFTFADDVAVFGRRIAEREGAMVCKD
ncbi:uncharacterized protein LTR77_001775 [Saxophila tyrrhenica]|uniref:Uncharacterized protein n=1 Tax=Saxophila tyrrhenica TaxID=1690608 RepID=A0AAV9PL25_9PEZI|nr:hypothetical protein LTR77_001775 [Saxophila tyrrhenica]